MSCSPRLSELRTHARPGRDTVLRLENRAKRLCCQAATSSERASRGSRTVKLAHRSHRGRQYPGERATVTNTLLVTGAYTWSWGFEVTHPAPQQEALHGVQADVEQGAEHPKDFHVPKQNATFIRAEHRFSVGTRCAHCCTKLRHEWHT